MPKKFHIMIQLSPKLSPKHSPVLKVTAAVPKPSPLQRAQERRARAESDDSSLDSFALDGEEEEEEADSDAESLSSIMDGLKEQMALIETSASLLHGRVKDIYKRAKEEEIRWIDEPLPPAPAVAAWATAHGLPAAPTMREFLDACFSAAISMDLTTRMLTFSKEDAAVLWAGKESVTIFDVIAALPRFFE